MASEAAEARAVLVCLGSRPEENAALWQWASRCFFEPQRDMLSLLHARTDTMQIMALNRVMHSAEPPVWVPPKVIESLRNLGFATPPRYLEIASDLSPGDAIVDWLQRSAVGRPDVVLLGSRGMTGLRRFLVGSVSAYVVESEAAPCLVVRSSLPARATACGVGGPAEVTAAAPEHERGRVIGIAVDGTPAGTALAQWCRLFCLRPRDRVTVLHGRPEKPKTDDELEAVDRAIEAMHAAVAALHEVSAELVAPPRAELLPEGGTVRDALVDWVEQHGADVLVVGSRGLGGALKRAVLGSVSSYAVQHAGCAVLVVSAPVLQRLARGDASEAQPEAAAQQETAQ